MDIAQPYLDAFMAAATEEGSPLPIGLLALAAVTVWCWVASIVTGNCSQVRDGQALMLGFCACAAAGPVLFRDVLPSMLDG